MKKNIMLFILLTFSVSFAVGQLSYPDLLFPDLENDICIEDSTLYMSQKTQSPCVPINNGFSFASSFLPTTNDSILYININLIFLQKDDGTGNFDEHNPEHQQFFDEVITRLNNIYASFKNPNDSDCYLGTSIISDSRIRFVDHRYYIRDSYGWNNQSAPNTLCPSFNGWYLQYLDEQVVADSNIPAGINIYFTENEKAYNKYWIEQNVNDTSDFIGTGNACSRFPSSTNLNFSSRIHMLDHYSKYWWMRYIVPQKESFNYPLWDPTVRYWHIDGLAMSLAHEIGHSLDLCHPDQSNYNQYPTKYCYYSLMNPAGKAPHNFLPPIEIGHMYTAAMTTNLRKYIASSTYLGIKELDTTISFPHCRFYHSLYLKSNADITMNCNMIMPPKAHIIIEGTLYLNGGELLSAEDTWQGITIKSGGVLILSDVTIKDYDIHVEEGGQLIIKDGFLLSGRSVKVDNGGYLCIDTEAHIVLNASALIHVASNAILGISNQCNCVQELTDLPIEGNGRIIDYSINQYLQNITIQDTLFCGGNNIAAGAHVTTEYPEGDVIIESGGNLTIQAEKTIVLYEGVEVKQGGTLSISNY